MNLKKEAVIYVEGSFMFKEIGVYQFHEAQRNRFKNGSLWRRWAREYPDIFDEKDCATAESQGPAGYHFYEWLAAVMLYQSFGFLSLIEKYEEPAHSRKYEIFTSMVPQAVLDAVFDYETFGQTQVPDLFVYAPDRSEWFLCEVKGKADRLMPVQKKYFEHLASISGKDIGMIQFKNATII